MRLALAAFLSVVLLASSARAQSTQGMIAGRVFDSRNGRPLAGATVTAIDQFTLDSVAATADNLGFYYLPQLSPGDYKLRVGNQTYQARQIEYLELRVAARLELNFPLRPLADVWEQGEFGSIFLPGTDLVLNFFGPDLDSTRQESYTAATPVSGALEISQSQVVDPLSLNDLPLAGRDAYTVLTLEPNVTSDQTTIRGLGLAVNGQRPSASNFLLDGLENNNTLVSGPLTPIAPESLREYRLSTNNYSAQYGRTSGFIANAVTKSGAAHFHGEAYGYLKNAVLDANQWENNFNGLPRPPDNQVEAGGEAGGPIPGMHGLFWFASYDGLRSRTTNPPQLFTLFTPQIFNDGLASPFLKQLLQQFPALVVSQTGSRYPTGTISLASPLSIDQSLAIARLDWQRPRDTFFFRLSIDRLSRPDFLWSPYPAFDSPLDDNPLSAAFGYQRSFSPSVLNEIRAAINDESLGWNRAHPEIPQLVGPVTLPGSPAFFTDRTRNIGGEILDNFTWTHGRHIEIFGADLDIRRSAGSLAVGADGKYQFASVAQTLSAEPFVLLVGVSPGTLIPPDPYRDYQLTPWATFGQEIWRVSPKLTLNFGLRYEHYGVPSLVSGTDQLVTLKPGMTVWQPNSLQLTPASGALYHDDQADLAPRFGVAWQPLLNTVLRAGWGLYYDHPFDNLWQTIRVDSVTVPILTPSGPVDFEQPLNQTLVKIKPPTTYSNFPDLTMFDPNFKNGQVQSYFYGIQRQFGANWSAEVSGNGALGRHLVTTDIINREFTIGLSRPSPSLDQDVDYRAPQGSSSYQAMTASLHGKFERTHFQIAYTWSHSIDNQSEPLGFNTFNFYFTGATSGSLGRVASFSEQYNSSVDRGNSDFDQRQNLVLYWTTELPSPRATGFLNVVLRNWGIAGLAAFRSGFPYTVYANPPVTAAPGNVMLDRADLDPGVPVTPANSSIPGGQALLNPAAFSRPPLPDAVGDTGRNAFRGPGLYNIDLSLRRAFPLPWFGETGRLVFRADAFNFLNHANLNNPDATFGDSDFGAASYGRAPSPTGFPGIFPLGETPRQVQLLLRVEW